MRVPFGEAGVSLLCCWFDFVREKKEDNILNVIHILRFPKS